MELIPIYSDDPKHLNMGNNKVACVVKTKVDLESKIN